MVSTTKIHLHLYSGANSADITWTALSGSYSNQQSQAAGHYYLTGNYIQTGVGRQINLSGNACLYLNGYDVIRTNAAPTYELINVGANTLNIFGEGEIIDRATGEQNMFSYGGEGTINIYGGNYTFSGSGDIFRDFTYTGKAASHIVLHGGTFNVNLNELTSGKTTFTIADGYEVKANDNNTWTVVAHTCVWGEGKVTEPSCTTAGYTTYTCACGDTYTADEVPALEHSYENGSCIHCGDTPTGVVITKQPVDVAVSSGTFFEVTVIAEGEDLTYRWYYKNAGDSKFTLSSVTKNVYATVMRDAIDGRQVYCIVADKDGNTVKSETVTLSMK